MRGDDHRPHVLSHPPWHAGVAVADPSIDKSELRDRGLEQPDARPDENENGRLFSSARRA